MVQKKADFILGGLLFLVIGVSTTFGYVPDPQLWFDAKDNPDHPEGWTNLGIAGKKLVANDAGVPVLEPHAGPDGGPAVEDVEEWWRGEGDYGLRLNEGEWTWIVITGSDETFRVYQDGVEVGKDDPLPFDGDNAMDDIAIGAVMYDERHRSFNGSFSIVRVYNRALSADEVQLGPATAVESVGKLTTTWGRVKATH